MRVKNPEIKARSKRREYRVLWWNENIFSGGGEYVADEKIFTSKKTAIKHASFSRHLFRTKIQWRNKGTNDGWKWLACQIPDWAARVRRACKHTTKKTERTPR